jgi:hypothetical protein
VPRYASGSPVRVSTEVRDTAGTLTAPGTILLRVKKPDGTFLPDYATPTLDSVGKYHQDIPAVDVTTIGHYSYVWITTGSAAGVSPPNGFDVIDPFEPELLSLQDAKAYLGETGTQQDDEIRAFAQVATEVVESIVGPCTPQTFTEQVEAVAGSSVLLLSRRPVISVTSITSIWGVAPVWLTAAVQVNGSTGTVRLLGQGYLGGPFYGGPFTVVYVAGRTVVPDRFIHAAREMLRHLWTTQRGQTTDSPLPDFIGDEELNGGGAPFGASFSIPNRVLELLSADRIIGIA